MIHLVTDSMSDLMPDEAQSLGVTLLPLTVRFSGRDYLEGTDLTREAFYSYLRGCKDLPKTSQIPPETYFTAFSRLLRQPEDELVCITGSSKISGCYNSARMALDLLKVPDKERRVQIVDSLIAISGEALLVRMASKQLPQCASAAELAAYVTELRDHQRCYGQAGDLRYLVMGGRLSPLVGKVGATLSLKPMLRFSGGEILQAGLVRGSRKALPWYAEKLEKHPPRLDTPIIIAAADNPALAEETARYMENWLKERDIPHPPIMTMGVGAVIGTHVGPDLVSVSWIEAT